MRGPLKISDGVWIAVDLCSRTSSLAIFTDSGKRVLAESCSEATSTGLEWFLPALQEQLEKAGVKLTEVTRWILPNGPGSFTGLRIGAASIKGILTANPGELILIDSLEARYRSLSATEQKDGVTATRVGKDQYAIGQVLLNHWRAGEVSAEDLKVLAKEKTIYFETAKEAAWENPKLLPLTAKCLGKTADHCQTKKTYTSAAEWIPVQPTYWGDTRFGKS